jgi:hypothetical protein
MLIYLWLKVILVQPIETNSFAPMTGKTDKVVTSGLGLTLQAISFSCACVGRLLPCCCSHVNILTATSHVVGIVTAYESHGTSFCARQVAEPLPFSFLVHQTLLQQSLLLLSWAIRSRLGWSQLSVASSGWFRLQESWLGPRPSLNS